MPFKSCRVVQSFCPGPTLEMHRGQYRPIWLWHACKLLDLQVALLSLSHMPADLEPVQQAKADRTRVVLSAARDSGLPATRTRYVR